MAGLNILGSRTKGEAQSVMGLLSSEERISQYLGGWERDWDRNREWEREQYFWYQLIFGSKVWCCKEQYCIGTWNVRSMNQGKLEVVKQEMARVNVDILGISELKWTGMGEFNSDDHYIYYCGQESLRRSGVAILVNRNIPNAVLGCNLKNDRMISVCFQGKPFNITVIQAYTQLVMLKKLKLNGSMKTYETL